MWRVARKGDIVHQTLATQEKHFKMKEGKTQRIYRMATLIQLIWHFCVHTLSVVDVAVC